MSREYIVIPHINCTQRGPHVVLRLTVCQGYIYFIFIYQDIY